MLRLRTPDSRRSHSRRNSIMTTSSRASAARSTPRWFLMRSVLASIRNLHVSWWPGLVVDEMVPCPNCVNSGERKLQERPWMFPRESILAWARETGWASTRRCGQALDATPSSLSTLLLPSADSRRVLPRRRLAHQPSSRTLLPTIEDSPRDGSASWAVSTIEESLLAVKRGLYWIRRHTAAAAPQLAPAFGALARICDAVSTFHRGGFVEIDDAVLGLAQQLQSTSYPLWCAALQLASLNPSDHELVLERVRALTASLSSLLSSAEGGGLESAHHLPSPRSVGNPSPSGDGGAGVGLGGAVAGGASGDVGAATSETDASTSRPPAVSGSPASIVASLLVSSTAPVNRHASALNAPCRAAS